MINDEEGILKQWQKYIEGLHKEHDFYMKTFWKM